MPAKFRSWQQAEKYDLAGLCRRVSKDRVARADKLSPREGWALIEALKAIGQRQASRIWGKNFCA